MISDSERGQGKGELLQKESSLIQRGGGNVRHPCGKNITGTKIVKRTEVKEEIQEKEGKRVYRLRGRPHLANKDIRNRTESLFGGESRGKRDPITDWEKTLP